MARDYSRTQNEQELICLTLEIAARQRQAVATLGPITHEAIARHNGIKLRRVAITDGSDGWYDPDRAEIVINTAVSRERQNFTFYHELMHHFIRQHDDLLSSLHELLKDESLDAFLERLCNIGAAEFLIPSVHIRRAVGEHGFTTMTIPRLCGAYEASGIAVAIQMVTTASHHCYLAIGEPRVFQPAQDQRSFWFVSSREALAITYAATSPSARYSIARGTRIADNHLMTVAFREQKHLKSTADIPFKSGKEWPVDCDVLYFRGSVYAFFNVESPTSPNQRRLI